MPLPCPARRERAFTPAEANDALPRVAARAFRAAREMRNLAGLLQGHAGGDAIAEAREEVDRLVEEIARSGARLTGVNPVRVEFPARLGGRPAVLEWSAGEPRVEWRIEEVEALAA